jgi:hypothetical protein
MTPTQPNHTLVIGESPTPIGSTPQTEVNPTPEVKPTEAPQTTAGHPDLAPRGEVSVTSANRGNVRKWLTSQGVPYKAIGNLPNAELEAVYNDTSDSRLQALQGEKGAEGTDSGKPESKPESKPEGLSEAQKAVQTLAKSLGLSIGGTDEAAVRKIAAEEAAKAKAKDRRITVVSPLGTRDLGERHLHPLFESVCKAVSVGVAPLVFGPAGSGKTTLAEQVAEALNLPFHFSGAVLKKHEVVGYRDANGNTVRTAFRDAFEHGGLFLFDEVDASSPQALLCINAALANGYCDFPEGRIKAHKDFRFIAAANTNGGGATREYSGRNQLDAATLDRFATFACEYDDALVAKLVGAYDLPEPLKAKALEWNQRVCDYRKALSKCGLRGVISPRCSLNGAKLIAAGFDFPQLAEVLVLNKFANPDDRKRLQAEAKAITEARTAPKPTPAV